MQNVSEERALVLEHAAVYHLDMIIVFITRVCLTTTSASLLVYARGQDSVEQFISRCFIFTSLRQCFVLLSILSKKNGMKTNECGGGKRLATASLASKLFAPKLGPDREGVSQALG